MVTLPGPGWIGTGAAATLQGLGGGSIKGSGGARATVQGWYAALLKDFVLPQAAVCGHAVTVGELTWGLALILGQFTRIAAFCGACMNINYMRAGTVSINPVRLILELLLILAWRVAGSLGPDVVALPRLGTPWTRWPRPNPVGPPGWPAAGTTATARDPTHPRSGTAAARRPRAVRLEQSPRFPGVRRD